METKYHTLKEGRTLSYMEFGQHISIHVPELELVTT